MAKITSLASSSDGGPALTPVPGGVRLRVRVKPGASRRAVLGRTSLPEGDAAVLVAVTEPPEGGKANDAVVALLAKAWRLSKTSIAVRVGATGRTKILEIAGEPAGLGSRLQDWLLSLPEA